MLKELDPEEAWAAIDGVEDILSDDMRKKIAVISRRTCPRCGSKLSPIAHPTTPFDGTGRPNLVGRCVHCGVSEDPVTGFILSTG